jgi:DNA-binding IclR family transcriptional regulator
MFGIEIDDTEARQLVRQTMVRTPDGWTTQRLAGRLGLPIGTVVRALVDLARRGVVVHLDDEWFAASALLDAERMPDG